MAEKLPELGTLIAKARREAFNDPEQERQLELAKKPIPAPPKGQPNITEIVRKKSATKYQVDTLYQQLGITAQAYNAVRSSYMQIQRLVEQFADRASKNSSREEKAERIEYENLLKQTGALLKMLKDMGRKKVVQVKEMEESMTKLRTDLFKAQRQAKKTPEEGQAQAEKIQNREYDERKYPFPIQRPPTVLLSPNKLLIKIKKELQAKEDSIKASKQATPPDTKLPDVT